MNIIKSRERKAQAEIKVKPKGAFRSKVPALWQFMIAALLFHVLMALALSPGMGKGDKTDVNVLIKEARELSAAGKFDLAITKYQIILNQKPQLPAVYTDAEREMVETRNRSVKDASNKAKAEEQEKKAATEGAAKKPDKKEPKKTGSPEITLPDDMPSLGD